MIRKLAVLAIAATLSTSNDAVAKQEPAPVFNPTLPWLNDLDEALAASKETGKPVLVEFR